MAAPYIAGIAALYIGKYGGRASHGPDFAKMLSRRIASSGNSVGWGAAQILRDKAAPPFQVGTGLVDARKVLHYETDLEYEPFSLMDLTLFRPDWNVTITNHANRTVRYNFSLEAQSAVDIYDPFFGVEMLQKMTPIAAIPEVELPPLLHLGSGDSQMVRLVKKLFLLVLTHLVSATDPNNACMCLGFILNRLLGWTMITSPFTGER